MTATSGRAALGQAAPGRAPDGNTIATVVGSGLTVAVSPRPPTLLLTRDVKVEVTDPVSGRTISGTIVSDSGNEVGPDAEVEDGPPADAGAEGGVPPGDGIVISVPDDAQLDESVTTVQVTFVLRETDGPVLAVPVPALTTTSGGSTYVVVVNDRDNRDDDERVEVEPGLSADGMVEIRTSALREGDLVQVSDPPTS